MHWKYLIILWFNGFDARQMPHTRQVLRRLKNYAVRKIYIYIMKVSELSIIKFAFWIWNTIWRKISMIIQNFIEANSLLLQFNNQPNYPLILYLIYYFYRKHIMNFALAHDDRHKVSTIMSVTWTGHIWVIFFLKQNQCFSTSLSILL